MKLIHGIQLHYTKTAISSGLTEPKIESFINCIQNGRNHKLSLLIFIGVKKSNNQRTKNKFCKTSDYSVFIHKNKVHKYPIKDITSAYDLRKQYAMFLCSYFHFYRLHIINISYYCFISI